MVTMELDDPDRLRARDPRRRRQRRARRRDQDAAATRRPRSWRSARSTPASTRSTAASCSTRSAGSTADNAQGELYLPDVLPLLRADGKLVAAHTVDDPTLTLGVNDRVDLAHVRALAQARIHREHMLAGVTIVDPASTLIDGGRRDRPRHRGRAEHVPARRDPHRRALHDRPALDADRHRPGRRDAASCTPTSTARRSAPASRSARSPTCAPTPISTTAPRSARSSRSRTPRSARARRCRTSPTSATPTSARARTSAPARSPPTTTAPTSTARRSAAASR